MTKEAKHLSDADIEHIPTDGHESIQHLERIKAQAKAYNTVKAERDALKKNAVEAWDTAHNNKAKLDDAVEERDALYALIEGLDPFDYPDFVKTDEQALAFQMAINGIKNKVASLKGKAANPIRG